jgi:hypothetical protein
VLAFDFPGWISFQVFTHSLVALARVAPGTGYSKIRDVVGPIA